MRILFTPGGAVWTSQTGTAPRQIGAWEGKQLRLSANSTPEFVWDSPLFQPGALEIPLPSSLKEFSHPNFLKPEPGENWGDFLRRLGVTSRLIREAQLPILPSTVLQWGDNPPGDILNLLSLVHFLNGRSLGQKEEAGSIDPFQALCLATGQINDWMPDGGGNFEIAYPHFLVPEGAKESNHLLDYFTLPHFFRSYFLQQDPKVTDIDLADLWGVSEGTVNNYRDLNEARRSDAERKMQMDNLEKLTANLSTPGFSEAQIKRFLIFLRYRHYFEQTMRIVDYRHNGDGLVYNPAVRPLSPSRIELYPTISPLTRLDPYGRIPFQREPFASAINGTADLLIQLMKRRLSEFELIGMKNDATVPVVSAAPVEIRTFETLSSRIAALEKNHADHRAFLKAQEQHPTVIRLARREGVKNFYLSLFFLFEEVYLHTRPSGVIPFGQMSLEYEIVPPTLTHPTGTRVDPKNQAKFYVIAEDILANSTELSPETRWEIFRLRVIAAYLRSQDHLIPGGDWETMNRDILKFHLTATGLPVPPNETLAVFESIEGRSREWKGLIINPKTDAILHQIFRGRRKPVERQLPIPKWWKPKPADEAVTQPGVMAYAEGLLSAYLEWYHSARDISERQRRITADPARLNEMLDELVAAFPYAQNLRSEIEEQFRSLLEAYNQREAPIRIHPVPETAAGEPFIPWPLLTIIDEVFEKAYVPKEARPHLQRLFCIAVRVLWQLTEERNEENIDETLLKQALEIGRSRNQKNSPGGQSLLPPEEEEKLFQVLIGRTGACSRSVQRLTGLIALFLDEEPFQSRLENTAAMDAELTAIFHLHIGMIISEPEPPPLEHLIRLSLASRFDAYESLREDLVQQLRTVYFQLLAYFKNQYEALDDAFEECMTEDLPPNIRVSETEFVDKMVAKVSPRFKELTSRQKIMERVEDLDAIVSLMPGDPSRLSRKLTNLLYAKSVLSILNAPLPPEMRERYPELASIPDMELISSISAPQYEILIAFGERTLLTVIALCASAVDNEMDDGSRPEGDTEKIKSFLNRAIRFDDPDRDRAEILKEYEKIRTIVTQRTSPIDLVSHLPEVVEIAGKESDFVRVGAAVQTLISRRKLPMDLLKKTEFPDANASQYQTFLSSYFGKLTRFYWTHRETIRKAPERKLGEATLDVERDCPELAFVTDELLAPFIAAHTSSDSTRKMTSLSPEFGERAAELFGRADLALAMKISFFVRVPKKIPEETPLQEKMEELFGLLPILAMTGASIPHLAELAREQVFEIYRRHQKPVMQAYVKSPTFDVARLVRQCPEIKRAIAIYQPEKDPHPLIEQIKGKALNREAIACAVNLLLASRFATEFENLFLSKVGQTGKNGFPLRDDTTLSASKNHAARSNDFVRQTFEFYARCRYEDPAAFADAAPPTPHALDPKALRMTDFFELRLSPYREPIRELIGKMLVTAPHLPLDGSVSLIGMRRKDGFAHQVIPQETCARISRPPMPAVIKCADGEEIKTNTFAKPVIIPLLPFHYLVLSLLQELPDPIVHLFFEIQGQVPRTLNDQMLLAWEDILRWGGLMRTVGADPAYVTSAIARHFKRHYRLHREELLPHLDYAPYVLALPELTSFDEAGWEEFRRKNMPQMGNDPFPDPDDEASSKLQYWFITSPHKEELKKYAVEYVQKGRALKAIIAGDIPESEAENQHRNSNLLFRYYLEKLRPKIPVHLFPAMA
jgi:hypothetical protein